MARQSRVPVDDSLSPELRRFLDSLDRGLISLGDSAVTTAQTDYLSGLFKGPLNQDYRIIERIPFAMTITAFYAKTASGTVTAALKINSTAVTGGSINVTSTQQGATPSASNVAAAGDALVLTCSSVSSPVDLSWVVFYTKTLAN